VNDFAGLERPNFVGEFVRDGMLVRYEQNRQTSAG